MDMLSKVSNEIKIVFFRLPKACYRAIFRMTEINVIFVLEKRSNNIIASFILRYLLLIEYTSERKG